MNDEESSLRTGQLHPQWDDGCNVPRVFRTNQAHTLFSRHCEKLFRIERKTDAMHTYQDNKRRRLGLGHLSPKDIHLKSAADGGGGAADALPLLW